MTGEYYIIRATKLLLHNPFRSWNPSALQCVYVHVEKPVLTPENPAFPLSQTVCTRFRQRFEAWPRFILKQVISWAEACFFKD